MMEQKKYIQIPSLDLNNDNNLDSTEQQELSLISLPLLKSESSHQNDSNLNALEHMTEQQFLTLLLNTHSSSLSPLSSSTSSLDQNAFHNLIKLKIKQRLCQLKVNDDASRLESLPFVRLALYRSPAILLTLSIEMIVAIVISRFEQTLKIHMLLTSFMPILSSVSGNIGLQASTATLRALATRHKSHKSKKDCLSSLKKELASALVISLCVGVVLVIVGSAWSSSISFGLVTGLSVIISSTVGGGIGTLSPFLFKNLNIDPAITAGPFETGVQDIIGITLYLSFAYFLL